MARYNNDLNDIRGSDAYIAHHGVHGWIETNIFYFSKLQ
jgi:hypothetical protein